MTRRELVTRIAVGALLDMTGGVFYEHGHRMVATTVGFLTIILALWLWRAEDRRWMRRLGWIALLAVIVQGLFGGLTVIYQLPPSEIPQYTDNIVSASDLGLEAGQAPAHGGN